MREGPLHVFARKAARSLVAVPLDSTASARTGIAHPVECEKPHSRTGVRDLFVRCTKRSCMTRASCRLCTYFRCDLTRHRGVRCHFCSQTLGSIQMSFELTCSYGFDVRNEVSAMRKGKFSCLHLFVCGVGSHDRFSSSGMGEFS